MFWRRNRRQGGLAGFWGKGVAAAATAGRVGQSRRRFGPTGTGCSVVMAAQNDQHLRSLIAWTTDRSEMNHIGDLFRFSSRIESIHKRHVESIGPPLIQVVSDPRFTHFR